MIDISVNVNGKLSDIWKYFTEPEHMIHWNFASEDWHAPWAKNDLQVGGKLISRMEAKDGSFGFDFEGIYTKVDILEGFEYKLEDGRRVVVNFVQKDDYVTILESFDPESENSEDMQRMGWQNILDNFKKYSESL